MPSLKQDRGSYERGLTLALCAYVIWGINPLYFRLFDGLPTELVVAHRTFWLFVMLLAGAFIFKRSAAFFAVLRQPKALAALLVTGILLTINWLFSYYAIESNRVLDSSFAYFISPLVAVFFGIFVLREKLRLLQKIGVGLAVFALIWIVLSQSGGWKNLSWLSLILAITWGLYGVVRKTINVDSYTGLLVENMFIAPIGLAYVLYSEFHGGIANLSSEPLSVQILVLNAGTITIIPMLAYGAALRLLPLSQVGILNYLSPFLQFILAVTVFGEHLSYARLFGFAVVWVAIVLFTYDGYTHSRKNASLATSE